MTGLSTDKQSDLVTVQAGTDSDQREINLQIFNRNGDWEITWPIDEWDEPAGENKEKLREFIIEELNRLDGRGLRCCECGEKPDLSEEEFQALFQHAQYGMDFRWWIMNCDLPPTRKSV